MHHLENLIQAIPTQLLTIGLPKLASLSSPDSASHPPSDIAFPIGVPPPALNNAPLTNPSTHFPEEEQPTKARRQTSVAPSYLYFDDEGSTRWQGETSCLPLLDSLVERSLKSEATTPTEPTIKIKQEPVVDWFPDRTPKTLESHPETFWKLISACLCTLEPEPLSHTYPFLVASRVPPDLMDK
jgi:hypothetical protein